MLYIIMIGNAVLMFVLWFFIGRDKRPTATIELRPPKHMDPLEMEYALTGCTSDRGIFSMILYWASKGLVELIESESIHVAKRIRDLPDEASEHAKMVFDALFGKQDHIMFEDMPAESEELYIDVKDVLEKEMGDIISLKSGVACYGGLLLFAAANSIALCCSMPETSIILRCLIVSAIDLSLVLGIGVLNLGALGYKVARDRFDILLGSFFVLLALAGSLTALYLAGSELTFEVTFFICFVVSSVCIIYMDKRNNNKIYDRIMGYKKFIKTVESEKLKELSKIDPHYGMDILPYAMLFNLGTAWTKKFEYLPISNTCDEDYIEELEKIIAERSK